MLLAKKRIDQGKDKESPKGIRGLFVVRGLRGAGRFWVFWVLVRLGFYGWFWADAVWSRRGGLLSCGGLSRVRTGLLVRWIVLGRVENILGMT